MTSLGIEAGSYVCAAYSSCCHLSPLITWGDSGPSARLHHLIQLKQQPSLHLAILSLRAEIPPSFFPRELAAALVSLCATATLPHLASSPVCIFKYKTIFSSAATSTCLHTRDNVRVANFVKKKTIFPHPHFSSSY